MVGKRRNVYTLVQGGDWQGLYKNDDLVIEDHRIKISDALNDVISSGGISEYHERECDYDWLDDRGQFPKSLTNVKFKEEQ